MVYMYAVVLTLVNLLCWVGILFGLPGTWLMVLFPVLLKWWQPGQFMVSWTVLGVAVGLAVLGEVCVFVLGACLGAFVGALLGNLWTGRTLFQSFAAGRGAAIGQLWGTVLKLAIGAIIAVMLAIAAFV